MCVLVVVVAVVADVSVAVVVVADVSVVIGHVPQMIGHAFWYSTLVTLLVHLATSSQAMSSTLPLQVSGGVVVVLVVTVMTTLQVAQSTGHSCWTASFVTPLVHIDCGYSLQMNGSAIPLHVDGHELQSTGHALKISLLTNVSLKHCSSANAPHSTGSAAPLQTDDRVVVETVVVPVAVVEAGMVGEVVVTVVAAVVPGAGHAVSHVPKYVARTLGSTQTARSANTTSQSGPSHTPLQNCSHGCQSRSRLFAATRPSRIAHSR
jgi:hypothetical protein